MRKIFVKREFSLRVLLPFERQTIGKVPIRQAITIAGKAKIKQNPYFTQFLQDRFKIYQNSLAKKHTMVEYIEAVRQWYIFHGYVDKAGTVSPWTAFREYELDYKKRHPDSEWHTPEINYPKKSHHGTGTWSKEREREKKKEWRQSAVGRASTLKSRQKAKKAKRFQVG